MAKSLQTLTALLNAPISNTDTEITVRGMNDIYGEQVRMAGTILYATLEPKSTTNQEIVSFTGITIVDSNTIRFTGVTRGLKAQPDEITGLYDADPALANAHSANVEIILSNNPQFYDGIAFRDEDETISGDWDFTGSPTSTYPTTDADIATKGYVDDVAVSGAPDASTTVKGNTRLSASPDVTKGTMTMTIATPCVVSFTAHGLTLNDSVQFTTTGALPTGITASTNYFVISTGLTANAFQISATLGGSAVNTSGSQSGTHTLIKTTPVAYSKTDTTVMLQAGFQAASETYGTDVGGDDTYVVALSPVLTAYTAGQPLRAKMTTANTGACTIDFGPGVKSVKLIDGTNPLDGNIGASKVHIFIYDGTNLVLQNPVNIVPFYFGDGSDGNVTISSNTTLTSDMYYNNLTINSTFTLNTGGYRVFVKGILTNNGAISNIGANGSTYNAGAGGANGSLVGGAGGGGGYNGGPSYGGGGGGGGGVVWISAWTIAVEGTITVAGGNGGNAAVPGGVGNTSGTGTVGGNSAKTLISSGTGGAGGASSSNLGGTGGTITTTKSSTKNLTLMLAFIDSLTGFGIAGGAGGGGGGNNSGGNAGGGGGGQGGLIFEMYHTLTTSGTRNVTGGNGGNLAGGGSSNGAAGSSGLAITVQI